ncbi:MAG: hypothetical protein WAT19_00680 [Ferruginibacter sp.]
MFSILRNISLVLLLTVSVLFANAQNITGTWEGRMGTEKLQINIEQKGSKICGYTHDYVVTNSESFCKAKFEGYLDGETNTWYLRGVQFFENSGDHVLMRLALWRNRGDGRDELRVAVSTGSLLSGGMFGDRDEVILRRVSATPNNLPAYLPPCFPKKEKKPVVSPKPETPKPVTPKPVNPKPVTPKPVTPKPVTPKPDPALSVKKDTIKKPAPVQPKPEATPIVKKMIQRRQSEQSRIAISSNHLNIKVYDNGEIDNDTVSIFYNKRLLISHKRLSDKPIEFDIDLDPGVSTHEITLFAENLGGIPPNTALVVVKAGNKRYELRSKASLQENAVLVFEYKPGGPE